MKTHGRRFSPSASLTSTTHPIGSSSPSPIMTTRAPYCCRSLTSCAFAAPSGWYLNVRLEPGTGNGVAGLSGGR